MALTDRLVDRLIESGVPLDRASLTRTAFEVLPEVAPLAGPAEVADAIDALVGLGPIEQLLRDPEVSDVLVNRFDDVWVERKGRLSRTTVAFSDPSAVLAAVERVIAPLGLRIDRASPAVDARLPDGSRLHAVIPPVAVDGPALAVRRFTEAVRSLEELEAAGGVDAAGAEILEDRVAARDNILVSGGTGSGKTTLLNLLSKKIEPGQRVVTVEDAAELRLTGHVVRLESRPANAEGAGEIPLRVLVRHALRLRPDRIIVGEVRGVEALDMIQAMSTGHDGSMSTVHANSPTEALLRIENLAVSGDARVAQQTVAVQLRAALDLIVQVERRDGIRRVASIAAVSPDDIEEVYRCS